MNCLHPNVKTYDWKFNYKRISYFGPLSHFIKEYDLSLKYLFSQNNKTLMILPCGYCINCFINKKYDYRNRCKNEFDKFKFSYFITLTYDDFNNPKVLIKKHIQNFCKYLKKYIGRFGYLLAGEYGDVSDRPHYHLVIFTDFVFEKNLLLGNGYFSNDLIKKCWLNRGFVSVKFADNKAVNYLTSYSLKSDQKRQNYNIKKTMRINLNDILDDHTFQTYIRKDNLIEYYSGLLNNYPSFVLTSKSLGFLNDLDQYKKMCNYELKKLHKLNLLNNSDYRYSSMFQYYTIYRPLILSKKYLTTDQLVNITVKNKKISFI